jgi:pyridoxal phosphate enzyme (YggS family)
MTEIITHGRLAELADRLAAVRARITAACDAAARDPRSVGLLAVTKTISAADVALLLDLGLSAFGENRAQEAAAKVAEVARLRPDVNRPGWHLIGRLQRNKANAVARWADRVSSVDSIRLAEALDAAVRREREAGRRSGPLPVLVQYSVDGDLERGGVPATRIAALAEYVATRPGLCLDGLMSVAPMTTDQEPVFADIGEAAARLRAEHPHATVLSAGMSGDLEIAIRHGSTEVRIGTALVGERPANQASERRSTEDAMN